MSTFGSTWTGPGQNSDPFCAQGSGEHPAPSRTLLRHIETCSVVLPKMADLWRRCSGLLDQSRSTMERLKSANPGEQSQILQLTADSPRRVLTLTDSCQNQNACIGATAPRHPPQRLGGSRSRGRDPRAKRLHGGRLAVVRRCSRHSRPSATTWRRTEANRRKMQRLLMRFEGDGRAPAATRGSGLRPECYQVVLEKL